MRLQKLRSAVLRQFLSALWSENRHRPFDIQKHGAWFCSGNRWWRKRIGVHHRPIIFAPEQTDIQLHKRKTQKLLCAIPLVIPCIGLLPRCAANCHRRLGRRARKLRHEHRKRRRQSHSWSVAATHARHLHLLFPLLHADFGAARANFDYRCAHLFR